MLQLAQSPREREVLLIGDVLIVKDEYRVLVHARVYGGHLVRGERPAQVNPLHLGGKARSNLTHLHIRHDAHRVALLSLPAILVPKPGGAIAIRREVVCGESQVSTEM